jgi:peptidoglycan hydrolase-like protein with peptidoglycan-binding domain
MVAAGIIKIYQKNIWITFLTIVISIFLSSFSYAKTYRWEDFTEPFQQEFELHGGQNVTIEIHFPEFLLKNLEKIPLFIDHSTFHSTRNYPSVQINNSIWATYNLTDSKFLNIKIKHLHVGLNKLKFFLKKDISERENAFEATIKELRFDFANLASLKKQLSENNNLKGKPEVSAKDKPKENSDSNKPKDPNRAFDKRTRKYLQHALKSLGYYHGRVDGVFGPKTTQAIKAYQNNKGEMPTGYLDKKTATEFIQIGKRASTKAGKKFAAKARRQGNRITEHKKNTDHQEQDQTDSLLLAIKNKIAEDQKEKARRIERSVKFNKVSKKHESKKAEVSINSNDGIVRTPEELGKRYQSLIDSFNLSMNKTFYNQMIASIESCDRTGYYVSGAFISHYLYMRFKDLASNAQTSLDGHRNTKLAERFKNTRNRLIMHYNITTENKQALKDVLHKCETYYQKTKASFLHSKN